MLPINFSKKRLITALVFLAGLVSLIYAVSFYLNNGKLTINLRAADPVSTTYVLFDTKTGEFIKQGTLDKNKSFYVKKSDYDLFVKGKNENFYYSLKVDNELSETKVEGVLTSELGREFIGSASAECMGLANELLYSYPCSANFKQFSIHVPATKNSPTYARSTGGTVYGDYSIESEATLSNQRKVVLLRKPNTERIFGNHSLYSLNISTKGAKLTPLMRLKNASASNGYGMIAFKNSFITHKSDLTDVREYISFKEDDYKRVEGLEPGNKSLQPLELEAMGNKIVATYQSDTADEFSNDGETEVVIKDGSNSNHFSIKNRFVDSGVCGTDKFCGLGANNILHIYDLRSKEPVLVRTVTNVVSFSAHGNRLVLATKYGVLELAENSAQEKILYTFGDYMFENLVVYSDRVVVRVSNTNGNKAALQIKSDILNNYIDKYILNLQKQTFIEAVSVYKTNIFIVPNLGKLEYQPAQDRYDYSETSKTQARQQINDYLSKQPLNGYDIYRSRLN
ncbi:MAG: hypothetical protein M3Q14_03760 [bacterium]|nr:hypothetical protein [bacterium]